MMVRRGLRNIAFDELQECTKNAMQTILSVQEVGITLLVVSRDWLLTRSRLNDGEAQVCRLVLLPTTVSCVAT